MTGAPEAGSPGPGGLAVTAVWMFFHAELRQRWRTWLALPQVALRAE